MGITFVRASRRAKAHTRRSLVKSIRSTAKKFASQKTIDSLRVKYNRSYSVLSKLGSPPGYNFNGLVRNIRARALGKKTSVFR